MANLDNAKIYKKISKTGTLTDQYVVVNLDATNFCVTISGSVYGVGNRFEDITTWAVRKRDSDGHVTVATPSADTDAANKGYVDNNFVNVGNTEQEIGGRKIFTNYLTIYDDGDDDPDASRPIKSTDLTDPDLFIYGTGFTLLEGNSTRLHHYAFPDHSGTIAMTSDIGLILVDLREVS